jgi:hypothetical protein
MAAERTCGSTIPAGDTDYNDSLHEVPDSHVTTTTTTNQQDGKIYKVPSLEPRDSVGSYFASADFREIAVCVVFFGCCMIPNGLGKLVRIRAIPYELLADGSYVRNLVYNEPDVEDTVPSWALFLLAVLLPLVVQLVFSKLYLHVPGHVHATVCVYLVAFGLNTLASESIKLYVGYLRPMFYSDCQPSADYQYCTSEPKSHSDRKSFISGHAST